jgi:signal transduction histidine kinase
MGRLQISEPVLERLLEATRRLARVPPEASLHDVIADSASTILEASGAALFLVADDSVVLTATSRSCVTLPLGLRIPHAKNAMWSAMAAGTPILVGRADAAPDDLQAHRPAFVVPLNGSTDVVAVLWMQAGSSESVAADMTLPVQIFATQAAMTLENARHFHEIEERKEREIATVAHELRNPIGAIINALRVLERIGAPDAQATELRDLIGRQATHLTRLIEDLLDVARLRHGKVRLQRERVDLREIVRLALDALKASGRAIEHEVRDDLAAEPLVVHGDATRLEQVVRNLLDNAVKYSPARTTIAVAAKRDGAAAVLRVRDEGIGIASEMLPRLFEPFAQAEAAGQRANGGLGLGLPLVQNIVQQHGGTITAHSDGIGKGSEIIVRLPTPPAGR